MTPEQYARAREHRWAGDKGPPEWPTGVRPISTNGLGLLGIGPDNRLYWDGHQLEVSRTIRFSTWQAIGGTMAAVGTFVGGMAALWAVVFPHP